MIDKEKILRVDIYDENQCRIISTKSFYFPKDFFKLRGEELVVIKTGNLPLLNKNQPITAIFEYLNGNRIKYETKIDICTDMQMNFHVNKGELLEERRSSFKLSFEFEGSSKFYERESESDTPIMFETPIHIKYLNINLGGVLFTTDEFKFMAGDKVNLTFLDGGIDLIGEVLRVQMNDKNEFVGYGCKFLDLTTAQEEKIARFILDCQFAERERRRKY